MDIQFLHEPGNPSWTAPKLQWLKFQIQFMVDLHNTVSLLKFRKDPQKSVVSSPHLWPGVLKVWGIDNDNTELWKHRGFGTSWLPGGDGFLGECNQRYWLLLRKEAQDFF
ncbi:hypothetical protein LHEH8_02680 [Lactobacillus helveticus]|uniref:Uncharacterized protein n=2 Tax=Lactobacillus helveticus TaxID=1587 RepID=A0A8H9F792_LACHE|nr:hypothetical protein LHEH8_02680 [Lactobacillus helveticus]GFP01400.1 hypothetical protein LHEW6_12330 [Lactobacillus helveticus]GFP02486.1 hypothetical protein LHEY10_04150 [Lactobacillus helveticus]GFP05685.1 hypothetical protein LMG22465_16980 [Lactobacillus helveticus]